MDIFEFEENESFEKRCGDIFLTTIGNVAIQCTMCDVIYKTFGSFIIHIHNHLYNEGSPEIEEPDQELPVEFDDCDDNKESCSSEALETIVESIETLDEYEYPNCEILEDVLKEEEIPISFLKELPKETQKANQSKINKNKTNKTVPPPNVEIPNVVRDVNRRKLFHPPAIKDTERKHKCPVCSLGFKDRNNMRQHLKRHSDEKQHGCPECGKKFYTPSEVKIHLKSHTSERNYLCSDCGKSYKSNFQLTCHLKRHKNQRDYKCQVCGKAFFDTHTLKDHMTVHSSKRPFVCSICSNNFPRRLALKNHMKLHENKREYKCKLCDAGYNQQAGLLSHMRTCHRAT